MGDRPQNPAKQQSSPTSGEHLREPCWWARPTMLSKMGSCPAARPGCQLLATLDVLLLMRSALSPVVLPAWRDHATGQPAGTQSSIPGRETQASSRLPRGSPAPPSPMLGQSAWRGAGPPPPIPLDRRAPDAVPPATPMKKGSERWLRRAERRAGLSSASEAARLPLAPSSSSRCSSASSSADFACILATVLL